MNDLLEVSTAMNFASQELALRWAKENLSEARYQEIYKSYKILFKRTLLFLILICIPIMFVGTYFGMEQPISKKMMRIELENMPKGATASVDARVDYDGNFYWTYDSKIYEYALKDYGMSPEGYQFGDKVKVFIDDEQNAIQVTAIEEGMTVAEKEMLIGFCVGFFVPLFLIICVYLPIAFSTFGKPWREFIKEYEGK